MRGGNFLAKFDNCILWRGDFRHRDCLVVLRTADGKGLCRRGRSRSLFPPDARRDLSACAAVNRYLLAIFGGKSQSSLPLREGMSTSTKATPAFESFSDAPVNAPIVLVKSGSCPTTIK